MLGPNNLIHWFVTIVKPWNDLFVGLNVFFSMAVMVFFLDRDFDFKVLFGIE